MYLTMIVMYLILCIMYTTMTQCRLAQSGRCQQPLYHQQPIQRDDKCHADVDDHGSKPADAQTPTVGTQSSGNVYNTFINIQHSVIQSSDIQLTHGQSQSETQAETEAELEAEVGK